MAHSKRKRRERKEVEFDLTPMIDVTFQLLIFFILVMKFKEIERRQSTTLPMDEGTQPVQPAPPKDMLTFRMQYDPGTGVMTYWINVGAEKTPENPLVAGTLESLIVDRYSNDRSTYRSLYEGLLARLQTAFARAPLSEKIELAMSPKTQESSSLHPDQTAPWGFVTLAIDVCTKFNQDRKQANQDQLSVTFKNMEASKNISQ